MYTTHQAKAHAVALTNQAQQIWGASQLYKLDKGEWPADVAILYAAGKYLAAAPTPAANVYSYMAPYIISSAYAGDTDISQTGALTGRLRSLREAGILTDIADSQLFNHLTPDQQEVAVRLWEEKQQTAEAEPGFFGSGVKPKVTDWAWRARTNQDPRYLLIKDKISDTVCMAVNKIGADQATIPASPIKKKITQCFGNQGNYSFLWLDPDADVTLVCAQLAEDGMPCTEGPGGEEPIVGTGDGYWVIRAIAEATNLLDTGRIVDDGFSQSCPSNGTVVTGTSSSATDGTTAYRAEDPNIYTRKLSVTSTYCIPATAEQVEYNRFFAIEGKRTTSIMDATYPSASFNDNDIYNGQLAVLRLMVDGKTYHLAAGMVLGMLYKDGYENASGFVQAVTYARETTEWPVSGIPGILVAASGPFMTPGLFNFYLLYDDFDTPEVIVDPLMVDDGFWVIRSSATSNPGTGTVTATIENMGFNKSCPETEGFDEEGDPITISGEDINYNYEYTTETLPRSQVIDEWGKISATYYSCLPSSKAEVDVGAFGTLSAISTTPLQFQFLDFGDYSVLGMPSAPAGSKAIGLSLVHRGATYKIGISAVNWNVPGLTTAEGDSGDGRGWTIVHAHGMSEMWHQVSGSDGMQVVTPLSHQPTLYSTEFYLGYGSGFVPFSQVKDVRAVLPEITTITPIDLPFTGGEITVTGTDFTNSTKIVVDDVELQTTSVSPTTLKAIVPPRPWTTLTSASPREIPINVGILDKRYRSQNTHLLNFKWDSRFGVGGYILMQFQNGAWGAKEGVHSVCPRITPNPNNRHHYVEAFAGYYKDDTLPLYLDNPIVPDVREDPIKGWEYAREYTHIYTAYANNPEDRQHVFYDYAHGHWWSPVGYTDAASPLRRSLESALTSTEECVYLPDIAGAPELVFNAKKTLTSPMHYTAYTPQDETVVTNNVGNNTLSYNYSLVRVPRTEGYTFLSDPTDFAYYIGVGVTDSNFSCTTVGMFPFGITAETRRLFLKIRGYPIHMTTNLTVNCSMYHGSNFSTVETLPAGTPGTMTYYNLERDEWPIVAHGDSYGATDYWKVPLIP